MTEFIEPRELNWMTMPYNDLRDDEFQPLDNGMGFKRIDVKYRSIAKDVEADKLEKLANSPNPVRQKLYNHYKIVFSAFRTAGHSVNTSLHLAKQHLMLVLHNPTAMRYIIGGSAIGVAGAAIGVAGTAAGTGAVITAKKPKIDKWAMHVKSIQNKNANMPFKEVLKIASKTYKK
jgi:hypothetical protein